MCHIIKGGGVQPVVEILMGCMCLIICFIVKNLDIPFLLAGVGVSFLSVQANDADAVRGLRDNLYTAYPVLFCE